MSDAADDTAEATKELEEPILCKTQQSASTLDERLRDELRKMLREELDVTSRQPNPAARPGELLDAIGEKSLYRRRGSVHEDQLVSMPGDVFSLMCVSPAKSQAFAYGLAVFAAKLFFYSVILFDICKFGHDFVNCLRLN